MSFVSYAQNYEDVMLIRALRGIDHGFYIDVGAQDPVADSVTKAFYEMGWSGINIEPVTHWFQRLVADRPHDTNLQLAVSDGPGQLHLFEVMDSGLSTTDPGFAVRHAEAGHQIRESDVECVTLDEICKVHRVCEVHFLKIDCEGGEAAALRGFSLERVRPWIILIEATEPNSQKPSYMEWESLLTERSYHFVYDDGLNRFYVADEQRQLDEAFARPPNVFDDFLRASEAVARSQLQATQINLLELRNVQRLAQIEQDREKLRASTEYLHGENERREVALVELRRMLEEAGGRELHLGAEVESLRSDLESLRAQNELKEQRLNEKSQQIAFLEAKLAECQEKHSSIQDLEIALARQGDQLSLMSAEVEELRGNHDQLLLDAEAQRKQIDVITVSLELSSTANSRDMETIEALKLELDKFKGLHILSQEHLHELRSRHEALLFQNEQLRQAESNLIAALEASSRKVARMGVEASALQQQAISRLNDLELIFCSRSWKITRPLRLISGLLYWKRGRGISRGSINDTESKYRSPTVGAFKEDAPESRLNGTLQEDLPTVQETLVGKDVEALTGLRSRIRRRIGCRKI
jgi:methyltransferase, FkbM family